MDTSFDEFNKLKKPKKLTKKNFQVGMKLVVISNKVNTGYGLTTPMRDIFRVDKLEAYIAGKELLTDPTFEIPVETICTTISLKNRVGWRVNFTVDTKGAEGIIFSAYLIHFAGLTRIVYDES